MKIINSKNFLKIRILDSRSPQNLQVLVYPLSFNYRSEIRLTMRNDQPRNSLT